VKSDVDLARRLRVSGSTVAMWKRRGSIPYAEAVKVAGQTGASISYLLTDAGEPWPRSEVLSAPSEPIIAAILRNLVRLNMLFAKGKSRTEREVTVDLVAREFFILYRNALNTLYELTAKHDMSHDEALQVVVRSLDPERVGPSQNRSTDPD